MWYNLFGLLIALLLRGQKHYKIKLTHAKSQNAYSLVIKWSDKKWTIY